MSKDSADSERVAGGRERYRLKASSNSATISGSILLNNKLTTGARVCAGAILLHQQNGDPPPTRHELADDLDVDTRTIARWLDELRSEHLIESIRDGRRNVYSFLKPRKTRKYDKKISDPTISDPTISDRRITDRRISDPTITCRDSRASPSRRRTKQDNSVIVASVGVGVGIHDPEKEEPTPTPRQPLQTDLGRYMARKRYMAAPRFDRADLDFRAYVTAIERMEAEGLSHAQVVYFLELDPPQPGLLLPVGEQLPDELPTDEQPPHIADVLPTDEQLPQVAEELPADGQPQRLDLASLWRSVLDAIQLQINRHDYQSCLRGTVLVGIKDGMAIVGTPTPEIKASLEDRFIGPLREIIGAQLGFPVRVRVVISR